MKSHNPWAALLFAGVTALGVPGLVDAHERHGRGHDRKDDERRVEGRHERDDDDDEDRDERRVRIRDRERRDEIRIRERDDGREVRVRTRGRGLRSLDTNHDGVITLREWPGSARSFGALDRNGDGVLSGPELRGRRER